MFCCDDEDIELFDSEEEREEDLVEEEWGLSWEVNDLEGLSNTKIDVANKNENDFNSSSAIIKHNHDPSVAEISLQTAISSREEVKDSAKATAEASDVISSPGSTPIERMELNDNKAGMVGLDKERINKIIHDASKGSKFYENEKKKERKTQEKIEAMRLQLLTYTEADKLRALIESDTIVNSLRTKVDYTRTLVHVDMDAFYAAVEIRDNPKLKDIPMAVGGNSMLCTSNYAARKFGVRAAMPGFIAKKLCPQLVIVPLHSEKYRAVSCVIREVFKEYDENFATVSLDEAYLDITDYIAENFYKYDENSESTVAELIVAEMRDKIFKKTQLTASAGIAHNMMLSKICSDLNKPNGQYYLKPDEAVITDFVSKLPIRKVHGIGKVSEQMLKALDVLTCADLFQKRDILYLLFSDTSFHHFMRVSMGLSANRITHDERKSMSSERTFHDISDTEQLVKICSDLCQHLAEDLAKENLLGRNVTLKYKLSSFTTKTRSRTLASPVSKADDIFVVARELLLNEINQCAPGKFKLRLMGVRVCQFVDKDKKIKTVDEFFANQKETFSMSKLPSVNPCNETSALGNGKTDEATRPYQETAKQAEEEKLKERVPCPICNVLLENDNVTLNDHIDKCLTKRTIKEIVKEQNFILNDESSSTANSQKRTPKKRKLKDCDDRDDGRNKKKTLFSFWKKYS